jgi:hypothetical protein
MKTMTIPIKVSKTGAANWTDREVEMDRAIEDWTENDLHLLIGKMQWFIGGQSRVATCEPLAGGYRATVAVPGMKAETMHPLPLSDALAKSSVWTAGETRSEKVARFRFAARIAAARCAQTSRSWLDAGSR